MKGFGKQKTRCLIISYKQKTDENQFLGGQLIRALSGEQCALEALRIDMGAGCG